MIQKIIKPLIPLRQFIDYYYIYECDNIFEFAPAQRVYPQGNISLVFHYHDPSLIKIRDKESFIEPRTVICGQQTGYYDISLAGKTGMILVVFHPLGAGMFFKIPMLGIKNRNIGLDYLVNREADELEDKILNAEGMSERVNIINNYFLEKFNKTNDNQQQILFLYNNLCSSKGKITIKELAEKSCYSLKQFERIFSSAAGLNPKQFLRIYRFQNILRMIRKNNSNDLLSLTLENGYYDQSHFIHEFKSFTGLTPSDFFNTGR